MLRLRHIQPQAIEPELLDPVGGVGGEVLADRSRLLAVKVDGVGPLVLVPGREVRIRERAQGAPRRAEVVVDHVQDDSQPRAGRAVDEDTEVVRRPVQARGREGKDAVVAPAEAACKLADRHDLHDRDAGARQLREPRQRTAPRPSGSERADVELVDDLPFQLGAAPRRGLPHEGIRIHNLRRPDRPLGLKARRRIRDQLAVHPVRGAIAWTDVGHEGRVVAPGFGLERAAGVMP